MEQKARARLIVDSDETFMNTLAQESKNTSQPILLTRTGRTAQLLLSDTQRTFTAVIINPALPDGYGLSVIRFAHRYRPATPIFLLQDGEKEPFPKKDLIRLGVQDYIKKPVNLQNLLEFPKIGATNFEASKALSVATGNGDTLDTEIGAEDAAFVPILAENFIAGSISYFDLYVQLSSGRYIKILKAGDSFSPERLDAYMKKGVRHFFLRKEAQEVYLNYCEKLSKAAVNSDKIQVPAQIKLTMSHGQEVSAYLQHHGVNESYIHYAGNFVNNVMDLVQKSRPEENPYLDMFLSNLAAVEHGTGVAMVASIFGKVLGIASSDPAKTIGMAGMLHDIGILQLPSEIRTKNEDETEMDPSQLALYRNHPIVGSEVLRSFKDVDPTSIQAVIQHHERRNKSGFPFSLGVGEINRVSEIVGLSDQLIHWIEKAQKNPKISPIEEVLKTITGDFSFPVTEAFKGLFCKPKN